MESQTFNMKRFGRLFSTEFMGGLKKNWVSLLVILLIELAAVVTVGTMSMLLGEGWSSGGIVTRGLAFAAFLAVTIIIVPTKLYEHVNDRSSGPAYLMLPASRLEKFVSMILNGAVIFPLALLLLFFGIDELICLVDPTAGAGVFSKLRIPSTMFLTGISDDGSALSPLLFVDDFIGLVLVFLLGTVFFKGHKAPKTILAIIVFSQAMSITALAVMGIFFQFSNPESWGEVIFSSPFFACIGDHIALFDTLNDTISNVLLMLCIWFRLKTLKL